MRLPFLLIACLAAAPAAAQDGTPVMVEFDLNGNPISPIRARDCARDRAAALQQHLALEDQRLAEDPEAQRTEFAFECAVRDRALALSPETTRYVSGFEGSDARSGDAPRDSAAASADRDDRNVRVEREYSERCTENLFERTCSSSGSVTIGSDDSESTRNAANALLESLMRRDD